VRTVRAWLLLLAATLLPLPSRAEGSSREPSVPALDAKSIGSHEADWPYYVSLIEAWQPPGASAALVPGLNAVLVRVERDGTARVDFGRDGIHRVPIQETDLVARARRIASGADPKTAPNFTFAITPRLADPASSEPHAFALDDFAGTRVFACWLADPRAPEFVALAKAVGPAPPGTADLFFPQGDVPDLEVREILRRAEHPMPFVLDHLSEPYTATILDAGATLPRFVVLSAEGRWLGDGVWDESAGPRARRIAEAALAGGAASGQ
jgi:hypothetical protein